MGGSLALLARGVWWRRWASLVLVLCAAVTVAGAAAGPLWGRASEASLLARTLQQAKVSDLAWTVTSSTADYGGIVYPPPEARAVAGDVERLSALPPQLDRLFDAPTQTVTTSRRLQVLAIKPDDEVTSGTFTKAPLGLLLARAGACEQVRLTAGRCPQKRTDLLLSDRSAKQLDVRVGEQVQLPELSDLEPLPGEPERLVFRVAGIYQARSVDTAGRFWFDSEDFDYAPATTLGSETLPARLDAVIVQPDLALAIKTVEMNVQQERVLVPGRVTLANADRVTRQLSDHETALAATSRIVEGRATAAHTVAGTVPGRDLVANTATFVGLQVVVFGWVVLFGLVAISVGARDPELALAKLRGLRGRRLAVHALTEPVALVVLAVPLGILVAWVAVRLTGAAVLLPGTPVTATAGLAWAVGATAAGSVLACALAAGRSLRMPVADQLRRQTPRSGTTGPAVTAVLITLAVVGVVLIRSLGRGAQAALPALLTPVIVGLAAGLVVGAAVQVLMRVLAGRTHRWPLGPYLAVRQLARQGSLTRTTALVTVATAVSGFAAAAYVVTATQREAQARLDVGADRVVHVEPVRPNVLRAATRTVDPQGRWAMAAVQRGEGPTALLAVDSARFGAAFPVPGGALATGRGLNQLVPGGIPEPLAVRGNTASVRVASSYVFSEDVRVGLQLRVVTPDGVLQSRLLGPLDGRPGTLRATLPVCAKGCTVVGVYIVRTDGIGAIVGNVDLVSLSIGGTTFPFALPEWRSARVDESQPDSAVTGALWAFDGPPSGVTVRFDASASVTPGIIHRDVPTELPAIVGTGTQLSLLGARQLVGGVTLEGGELPFSIAGRTRAVPRAGEGSMVDLDLVSRVEPPRSSGLDFQVWLGRTAPADAAQRLAKAGLTVVDVETVAQRQGELDDAEPARAQLLLLGAGAAVLLAGVAGIATVLAAAARRRAVESAALHAMAVPGRTVRGSAVLEDVLLLLPGVIAGAVCASSLVFALTPVLAQVTGASAVVDGPPALADVWLPVLAAAAVTGLLLVPVVLAVTRPAAAEAPLRVTT